MGKEKSIDNTHTKQGKDKKVIKKSDKKDKFNKLNQKCDEFEYKYKRALADYQNLIKRTSEEKQEFAKYANEHLIHEIIPVYDNLKMSLKHTDKEASKNGWLEGVKHVVKQFKDTLKNLGVEEINTVNKKFDPYTMEAIEGKGEKVKKEIKTGYKLNGKVIISAKVILE